MTIPPVALSARTAVNRHPERQVHDRQALYAVLDAGVVAHLAVNRDDGPVVLPILYARDDDRLLLHGSTAAGALRLAAEGRPVAVGVTLLDGLVFAATMFNASANYRSAVVLGRCSVVPEEEKAGALRVLSEHLMPGRWAEVGEPNAKELAATLVLALPLAEASVKVRTGPPADDPVDGAWRGVLPVRVVPGPPVAAPGTTEAVPASVRTTAARLATD